MILGLLSKGLPIPEKVQNIKTQDMVRTILVMTGILFINSAIAQKTMAADWQLKTALMAVPDEYKEGAKVYGYDQDGKFTTLREGTNDYIALASDPKRKKFSTAAYHKALEPFMARGRELKAAGKEFQKIFDIREAEVKSGKLQMPDKATLYVFTGSINETTQEIENPYLRSVFYIPYATGQSTGLPVSPMPPGQPWLMDPGTHRAHIMISPPKK